MILNYESDIGKWIWKVIFYYAKTHGKYQSYSCYNQFIKYMWNKNYDESKEST